MKNIKGPFRLCHVTEKSVVTTFLLNELESTACNYEFFVGRNYNNLNL